jgi:aminomethyltransferase
VTDPGLRQTPLLGRHRALGARLVPFAGWEMPLQYAGILAEHRAVREAAGLFDVSHMGRIAVRGPGAGAAVDHLCANDPRRLVAGRALYTPLCAEDGGTLDDAVLYCRRPGDDFLFVVNAANREADLAWMREVAAARAGGGPSVEDVTDGGALLALQGPRAAVLLSACGCPAAAALRPFRFARTEVAGVPCLASRTGYTGEDGFELLCAAGAAGTLWDALLGAGAVPCGLGARDTLRLEAGLPLYGHELRRDVTPLEAGLGRFVRLEGREPAGAAALRRMAAAGPPRRLAGLLPAPPAIARAGAACLAGGLPAGEVTSGTFAPSLGRAAALALLRADAAPPLQVEVRGRAVPAEEVPLPFYRRRA